MRECRVHENAALGASGMGGGLHVAADGEVRAFNTAFHDNAASGSGGGISVGSGAIVELTRCEV